MEQSCVQVVGAYPSKHAAYWSATDQASLRIAPTYDTAYVLGRTASLFTNSNLGPDTESIPGLTWSREGYSWDKVAEVIR